MIAARCWSGGGAPGRPAQAANALRQPGADRREAGAVQIGPGESPLLAAKDRSRPRQHAIERGLAIDAPAPFHQRAADARRRVLWQLPVDAEAVRDQRDQHRCQGRRRGGPVSAGKPQGGLVAADKGKDMR